MVRLAAIALLLLCRLPNVTCFTASGACPVLSRRSGGGRSSIDNTVQQKMSGDGDTTDSSAIVHIALTRERGKNEKLRRSLLGSSLANVELHELPCIAHAEGPDAASLPETLLQESWDYVVVTSPEAARVLAAEWSPNVRAKVAAVGKATEQTLVLAGIDVDFVPSRATAACLVEELPFDDTNENDGMKVLYPASARAPVTLADGLTSRGWEVTRLDTYDTVPAVWSAEEQAQGQTIDLVCFASPSALKGWLANYQEQEKPVFAACIGETSATACRKQPAGTFAEVLFPDLPGLEGWVDIIQDTVSILRAMQSVAVEKSIADVVE